MLRYVLVDEREVDPRFVAMAHDLVRAVVPELDLGADPEIRWFADARELSTGRVAAAAERHAADPTPRPAGGTIAIAVADDGLPATQDGVRDLVRRQTGGRRVRRRRRSVAVDRGAGTVPHRL